MARGIAHGPEVRAAVLAALLAGQSVNKVAEEFSLSKSTVIAWRDSSNLSPNTVEPEKRKAIGDEIIDLIHENLQSLKAQVRLFSDSAWLKSQNAADVAVLHGVIADKTFRLLGALKTEPDESADGEDAPGTGAAGAGEETEGSQGSGAHGESH